MSRTKKGSKRAGFEYGGKRSLSGFTPSASVKKLTSSMDRARAKEEMKGLDQEESKSQIKREVDALPEHKEKKPRMKRVTKEEFKRAVIATQQEEDNFLKAIQDRKRNQDKEE